MAAHVEHPVADPHRVRQIVAITDRVSGVVEHAHLVREAGALRFARDETPLPRLDVRLDERARKIQRPDIPDYLRDLDLLVRLLGVGDETADLRLALAGLEEIPASGENDRQRDHSSAENRRALLAPRPAAEEQADQLDDDVERIGR